MATFKSDGSLDPREPSHRARRVIDYARSQAERAQTRATLVHHRSLPTDISFPGYSILEEVHRGGQGVVYRASQLSTRREVAIKVIRNGSFASHVDRIRFKREVRVLSQLRHPNIVSLQDGGVVDGSFYLVMDFIEGDSLQRYVERCRLPIREILTLMVEVCDAVHAAHLRGIVHRDLKPNNILVDQRGEPRVLDFGLAKLVGNDELDDFSDRVTVTGQFVGSLPWAAPEQVDGRSQRIDIRTDVYALGMILYVLVTGRFPYEVIGGMRTVVDSIVSAEPLRPSLIEHGVDQDLDTIILKCLSKQNERRYESAGDLARELRRLLTGEPIEARKDSTWYVLIKTFRRHRRVMIPTLLAIVLLVVALVVISTLYARTLTAERAERHRFSQVQELARTFVLDLDENLRQGATATREFYVKTALPYLHGLSKEASQDAASATDLIMGYVKVGDVQGNPVYPNLGDVHGAWDSYQAALRLATASASRFTEFENLQQALGTIHDRLGDLKCDVLGFTRNDALQSYNDSAAIREALVAANPDSIPLLIELGQTHEKIGNRELEARDFDNALASYERCKAIWERVALLEPMSGNAVSGLAVALRRIGDVHWVSGDRDAGLNEYHAGLSLIRNVAIPTRDEPRVRRAFVRLSLKVGRGLIQTGVLQEALQIQREAEVVARMILGQDGENAQARVDLADNLNLAGEIHLAAANPDAAKEAVVQARELLSDLGGGSPEYTVLNAIAKSWGLLGQAMAMLEQFDEAIYSLERSIAIRQSIVKGDATPAKREPLAVDYLDLAELNKKAAAQSGCDTTCQIEVWRGVLESQQSALVIFGQLDSEDALVAKYANQLPTLRTEIEATLRKIDLLE